MQQLLMKQHRYALYNPDIVLLPYEIPTLILHLKKCILQDGGEGTSRAKPKGKGKGRGRKKKTGSNEPTVEAVPATTDATDAGPSTTAATPVPKNKRMTKTKAKKKDALEKLDDIMVNWTEKGISDAAREKHSSQHD